MNQDNVYQAPQSAVLPECSGAGSALLASRWARLGASLLDGIILGAVMLPLAFALGFFDAMMAAAQAGTQVGLTYALSSAALGIVGFLALNGYMLAKSGQTIGKKLLGIKVVDMESQLLPFGKLIGLRYVPLWVAYNIPAIGGLLALVDTLFIFRSDKRCIHDLIAGTQVVNC